MLDFDNNKNDLKEIAEKVGIFKRASSVNLISGCLHRDFLMLPPPHSRLNTFVQFI